MSPGPPVLQRVPRWKKRHLGLQDTQGDWFLSENIHLPAITSAQNDKKQTENQIRAVKLTVPKMRVSLGTADCARAVLPQEGGGLARGHGAGLFAVGGAYWPIGLSPLYIPILCGFKRVLVVWTEPLDDMSCLTTPGSAVSESGRCLCH